MKQPTKRPKIDRTKLMLAAYQAGAVLATTLAYISLDTKLPRIYGD